MYLEGQCIIWKQNAIIQLKINELPATAVPSSPSCTSLLTANGKALGLCHVLKKLPCAFNDRKWQNLGFTSQG